MQLFRPSSIVRPARESIESSEHGLLFRKGLLLFLSFSLSSFFLLSISFFVNFNLHLSPISYNAAFPVSDVSRLRAMPAGARTLRSLGAAGTRDGRSIGKPTDWQCTGQLDPVSGAPSPRTSGVSQSLGEDEVKSCFSELILSSCALRQETPPRMTICI